MPEAETIVQEAADAHGGSPTWSALDALEAQVSLTGVLPALKWQRGLESAWIRVHTQRPRLFFYDFPRSGQMAEFAGDREVRILGSDGTVLATRPSPRRNFRQVRRLLYWDRLDFAYVAGYTLWNALNVPFLCLQEGVMLDQLPNAGPGRRVQVRFPARYPTHSQTQILTLGEDRLVRRLEYTIEPVGRWARAGHSFDHYETFAGLQIATRQLVTPMLFGSEPRDRPVLLALLIHGVRPYIGSSPEAS